MATYIAYEVSEGKALEDVEAYCGHLTNGGSFNDYTQPKGSDVERWLTQSYYWVVSILAANGYAQEQTDEEVLGFLQEINVLDVVCKVELANPVTGTGEPNDRFEEFKRRLESMIDMVSTSQALEVMGANTATSGSASDMLALTGISKSRKRQVESDSDYVQPRFRRGFNRNPRTGLGAVSETDYVE